MSESDQDKVEISTESKYGVSSGVLYGIGCGIGGSIFILLGTAIEIAGPGVLISLILGGILILLTALNYSELSTSIPLSGGAYNFGKEGVGGFAFLIGFSLWIANITTCVFSALALTVVIELLIMFFTSIIIPPQAFIPLAIMAIIFITSLYFKTQTFAIKGLIYFTIILLLTFLVFIISGLFIAPITNSVSYYPEYITSRIEILSVFQVFALLFICYTSITSNLAYFNVNLENRAKNIPKVNIFAILATLGIYLAITYVVLINIQGQAKGLSGNPVVLAEVLLNILGPVGFVLMCVAAIISTFIAMNAALGSAVSVFQALARDKYFPEKFKEEKKGIPVYAILITASITIIFTLFINIDLAAGMTVMVYFIALGVINLAAFSLRAKRKELVRPFKAPLFPILPIFVATCCFILAGVLTVFSPFSFLIGILVLIFGFSYYLVSISERHSIVINMAGIKFIIIILIGILIWMFNNLCIIGSSIVGFETTFKLILLRILIAICVIGLVTVVLDIIPLREFVYKIVKKLDKSKVAINLGGAQIIELDKRSLKAIYFINIIIAFILLISSAFILYFVYLFGFDIITIEFVTIGGVPFNPDIFKFLFISAIILFSVCLFISGSISLYTNKELKTLGM